MTERPALPATIRLLKGGGDSELRQAARGGMYHWQSLVLRPSLEQPGCRYRCKRYATSAEPRRQPFISRVALALLTCGACDVRNALKVVRAARRPCRDVSDTQGASPLAQALQTH